MLLENKYKHFIENNPYPRKIKSLVPIQGSSIIEIEGKKLINFSSSDYLGLSNHSILIQRSQEYAAKYGIGSSASRLVTGNIYLYDEIEKKLAHALNKPAALIFGTGYQANLSVLEALLNKKILQQEPIIFCDRFIHNSMIQFTRHLGNIQRFRHNDLTHLQLLLEKFSKSEQPKFILVESIYSMDGDQVDLSQLVSLAKQYQAFLYVDDAHAVGLYGQNGWGKTIKYAENISLIMGTFSKALGSFGGYVGCSEVVREYLINHCKGFIYSTALPPSILGAISAVIDLLPELLQERERVQCYAAQLRSFMDKHSLNYGTSQTHIVPWIIGDAKTTVYAAKCLEEYGILGTAIQPPTVPVGFARIRFCMSAKHTEQDLNHLCDAIGKVAAKL